MKRNLLNISLAAALLAGTAVDSNAQWQLGGTAPNFTEQDINGNTVDLYELLDKNMAVIIDVSATWCGPCWSYHQTHALETVYNTYGEAGTGELTPIFIEGDPSTGVSALQGSGNTTGNWVAGTSYPMINKNVVPTTVGYPTIWLVCPDRKIVEVSSASNGYYRPSASQAIADARSKCEGPLGGGGNSSDPVDAELTAGQADGSKFCGDFDPSATLKNKGTNNLTSATITLKINGQTQETKNWTGNLAQGDDEVVNFNTIAGLAGQLNVEYEVTVSNDANTADNKATVGLEKAPLVAGSGPSTNVTIEVRPDAWGSEVSWEVKSPSNATVLSGGPYQDYTSQSGNGWTADTTQITTDEQTLTVESSDAGCYKLITDDAGSGGTGDGFFTPNYPEWGKGYYRIKDGSGNEIAYGLGNEDPKTIEVVFEVSFSTGLEEAEQALGMRVFPQPAADVVNVNLDEVPDNATLTIFNALGQEVYTQNVNSTATSIDVTNLDAGTYMMNIASQNVTTSQQFMIVK